MKYNNNFEDKRPICVGIGLVALDVLLKGKANNPIGFYAGGSCGNVLTILSYLDWQTFPIARLKANEAANILLEDLKQFGVNNSLISLQEDGSTPIIIHRVSKDKEGNPKHRFEFRNPETGNYLPSYKPVLSANVDEIFERKPKSNVFYLDRVNRASIELAKISRNEGAIVFFEPPSYKNDKIHNECMSYADIVKFAVDRVSNYQDLFPVCTRQLEIMTMGTEGLAYRTKNQKEWIHIPAYDIGGVVDAAGSGDWCTAGIIYSLYGDLETPSLDSDKVEKSLKFGQALAALNCCFMGARGAMYAMENGVFWESVNLILSTQNDTNFCLYNAPSQSLDFTKEFTLAYLY